MHTKTRAPMTATEAREIIATMRRETQPKAMRRLIEIALKMGNLSDEAKAVYRAAL